MSAPNINDPAAVRALLEQLQSSRAWLDATAPPDSDSSPPPPPPPSASGRSAPAHKPPTAAAGAASVPAESAAERPSVAALLAQLQAGTYAPPPAAVPATVPAAVPPPTHPLRNAECAPSGPPSRNSAVADITDVTDAPDADVIDLTDASTPPSPRPPAEELRDCSFQQALPHLARLGDDRAFVTAVRKMKWEQADLENKLWMDRLAIVKSHEGKVKVAQTKAAITGGGISQFEADALRDACERELQRFDHDRVLPALDALVSRQQGTLERLGVPTMFLTDVPDAIERQQRVMQVLEGVIGGLM